MKTSALAAASTPTAWAISMMGSEPVIRIPVTHLAREDQRGVALSGIRKGLQITYPTGQRLLLDKVDRNTVNEVLGRATVLIQELRLEEFGSADHGAGIVYEAMCNG